MKVYKVIAYLYLAFAVLFAYQAYEEYQAGKSIWLHVVFVIVAIFMFVFRLKNSKKYDANSQSKK